MKELGPDLFPALENSFSLDSEQGFEPGREGFSRSMTITLGPGLAKCEAIAAGSFYEDPLTCKQEHISFLARFHSHNCWGKHPRLYPGTCGLCLCNSILSP